MKKTLTCCILCVIGQLLLAAETVVVGDVLSATTGEPIANASVYYAGTHQGTAADENGSFCLKADLTRNRTLVVSAIGYHSERYNIVPGTMAGLQVELREQAASLQDVFVLPGENPAIALVQAVRSHRSENDRTLHPEQTNNVLQQTELYLSDIQSKHLRHTLWNSLKAGMLQAEDSVYLLPLYNRQQMLRLQGNDAQPTEAAHEKAVLLSTSDYSALLNLQGNLCFYRNNLSLMGHSFLSPLATAGNTYYNFYLTDSLLTNEGKAYLIHFRPKNPFYATLEGEMAVDSATLALRSVNAIVPPQSSVNYLRDLRISQTYHPDHTLQSEDISVVLDFAVRTDQSHLFPTVLIRQRLVSETNGRQPAAVQQLTQSVRTAAVGMDSLQEMPLIRTARWIANTILTGYMSTPYKFDIGPVDELIQINPQELVHLGFAVRTNEHLWKDVSLAASVGYGVRDQAWKGSGRIQLNLPTQRRHILTLSYHDQYTYLNEDDFTSLLQETGVGWRSSAFLHNAIDGLWKRPEALATAARQRQVELYSENDWSDILDTRLYARMGWQNYLAPETGYNSQAYFRYHNIGAIFRLSWHERTVDNYFQRRYVYSQYPTLYIGAEGGSWSLSTDERYHMYSHLRLMVHQTASLGMGGTLDWALQAGYIIGSVPYSMLHLYESFPGVTYGKYRFSLMNDYQFAADKYLTLHAEWNGQGILFNLIPGVRYLRLRELVSFKMAYGGMSEKNQLLLQQMGEKTSEHALMHAPTIPHIELGIGIGNILRVADLYAIWRLTNRQDPSAPLWGIRFRFNVGL